MSYTLETHPLFCDLWSDDIATLALFSEEQILTPHETLFRQGDEANALYIVMDGKLEVYKNTPQWGVALEAIIEWGSVCGEMAFFDRDADKIRNASVRSGIEGATVRILVDTAIMDLSEDHPSVYQAFEAIVRSRKK